MCQGKPFLFTMTGFIKPQGQLLYKELIPQIEGAIKFYENQGITDKAVMQKQMLASSFDFMQKNPAIVGDYCVHDFIKLFNQLIEDMCGDGINFYCMNNIATLAGDEQEIEQAVITEVKSKQKSSFP